MNFMFHDVQHIRKIDVGTQHYTGITFRKSFLLVVHHELDSGRKFLLPDIIHEVVAQVVNYLFSIQEHWSLSGFYMMEKDRSYESN